MAASLGTLRVIGLDPKRVERLARVLTEAGYRVMAPADGDAPCDLAVCPVGSSESVRDVAGLWASSSDVLGLVDGVGEAEAGVHLGGSSLSCIPLPENKEKLLAAIGAAVRSARERREHDGTGERFRRLMDETPVGVFEIEGERLTYVNQYLVDVSKYPVEELLGMSVRDLVAPGDVEQLLSVFAERLRGEKADGLGTYRVTAKDGEEREMELTACRVETGDGVRLQGTARDVTAETRLVRLHSVVLELAEVILGEQDTDRILQIVLDTITEYSGFRRAVLTLYDLSVPSPVDGAIMKMLTSGLSPEERRMLLEEAPLSPSDRRCAFSDEFRLGPAYYIPHDRVPWAKERGIVGTLSMDGWHVDDFLLIPLRGTAGVVGCISVDDPIDQNAPTLASIEPIGHLACFAALAVERVYKLNQLRDQNERLHSLSRFGDQVAHIQSPTELCDAAARRICDDMGHDYCAVWLREGESLVLGGVAASVAVRNEEIPARGSRKPLEGAGLTRWAVRYVEPVVADDVSRDPRYQRSRAVVRSMAAIPIHGRKGVRGALDVESQRLAAFGEQDLRALSTVASQVSVALSSLERREAFERIYSFGQRISEASNVDQIVASTLDLLAEQFGHPLSFIFLQGRDGRLSLAGQRTPPGERASGEEPPMPGEQGIVSWVARNRRFALVSDVTADPRYLEALPGMRSEIAVPLLFSETLIGVLDVESPRSGFFDDEDRVLLEVIGNNLATALANLSSQESLREQAIRDPLTGLFNRHYFNTIIAPELSRSDRYAHPFTVMMIDVDNFRAVNNRFGHLKGDDVLQEVSRFLLDQVREADRVIRYGGDEFLIFMPETEESEATAVASRLRKDIIHLPRRAGVGEIPMGLSIGICTRKPREKWSLEAVLDEADRRLFADKRARHVERADDYRR